uniref:Uncharacterized protein n=1 Tax=Anguilla anguilla TaxID=7936 RepID=A0A0E9V8D3_ANGAN
MQDETFSTSLQNWTIKAHSHLLSASYLNECILLENIAQNTQS